jgi:hypothetical protein
VEMNGKSSVFHSFHLFFISFFFPLNTIIRISSYVVINIIICDVIVKYGIFLIRGIISKKRKEK